MTSHALKRSKERFNHDNDAALKYFRSVLRNAKKIGETTCSKGKKSTLYAHGRIAIYVSMDKTTIHTVNKFEQITYSPLKCKIANLAEKEFNKLNRQLSRKTKRLAEFKLEAQLEISQCELRKYRSRSVAVKNVCAARINAINERLVEFKNEITDLQSEIRQVSRSMVAVI